MTLNTAVCFCFFYHVESSVTTKGASVFRLLCFHDAFFAFTLKVGALKNLFKNKEVNPAGGVKGLWLARCLDF